MEHGWLPYQGVPVGSALDESLRVAIQRLGSADVIAGIPSYNNAGTIEHVVRTVREGLRAAFPGQRTAIVNADGGSTDGTADIVRDHDSESVPVIAGPYSGPSGKGSALRAVFEAADRLGARAACVLDSDLRSVTPEWVARLAGPVAAGRADYVAPLYVRHKHDGTITNTVVYPLVRSLYGARVRQPIGGEFGFSRGLARAFLEDGAWDGDVARFGIDIFMTTTALARGARIVQAALGAKVHDPKDPAVHLRPMFSQVLTSAVEQVGRHRHYWRATTGSRELPIEGELAASEPADVPIDLDRLDSAYADAGTEERRRWAEILCDTDRGTFHAHVTARRPADAALERTWARIVFDVVAASLRDPSSTPASVRALLPMYLARVAAHARAADAMSSRAAESLVESQAAAFEAERAHLEERLN